MKKSHLIILITSVFVTSLGGFLAYLKRDGISYRISSWRADSLIQKSEKLSEEGDWKEASEVSLAAWQLDEGDIDVLRQVYKTALKTRSPHLLATARALFTHPAAGVEERLDVIGLYLTLGDHVTVASMLAQLTPEERSTPAAMKEGAEFLLVRNRPIEAMKLLEELRKRRDEPGDAFLVANALARLSSEDDLARKESQRIIDELIAPASGAELAISAFRLLEIMPEESWDLARFMNVGERLQTILGDIEMPLPVRFLEVRLRIAADPSKRDQFMGLVVDQFFAENREEVGEWLVSMNETGLLQKALAGMDIKNDPIAFSLLIKSYFREGNWEKASDLMKNAPPQLDPAMLFALNAVVATATGEGSLAKNWWERAIRQAGLASGRGSLMTVAKIAASAGNESVRNRAVTEALKRRSAIPIPASDVSFIFSHLVADDAGNDLLDISLGMLAAEPDNPLLVNNVAWLTLMNRRSAAQLIEKLEELTAQYRKPAALHTTLALAYHHEGKNAEAGAVIEGLMKALTPEELAELSETDLAVIKLVQRDSGLTAAPLAKLDWSKMMAIERDFFEGVLSTP